MTGSGLLATLWGLVGFMIVIAGLRAVLKREPDRFIARVVALGLLAKLAGSGVRYFIMGDLYGGRGDFQRYLRVGGDLAVQIRSGTLPDEARETGTAFMEFLAGVVFAVAPTNLFVGFVVFSLLAFVGAYLFLQAFRLALPEGDHRRYALLVMFLPTMLFWPSSLGKEAWLVFGLGLGAYGATRVLRRLPHGYWIVAFGAAATYQVRPHMGALFAISFAGAFILRSRDKTVRRGGVAWIVGLVLVATGTVFAAANFGDEVPRDESVEGSTVDQVFAETGRRTTQGGSEFNSRPVRNPTDFVHAAVSVPFRPFPTETHNVQALMASLEGVFLLFLLAASLPRLRAMPRLFFRRPYLSMVSVYCVGFIIGFSNVGNFGILTRQRAQLIPFLAVLLALPKLHQVARRRRGSLGPLLAPARPVETDGSTAHSPTFSSGVEVQPRAATGDSPEPPTGAPDASSH